MTDELPGRRGVRNSRFLFPALIASLALNLLVVGGISAAAWHHHHFGRHRGEAGLLGFANDIAEPHRQAVRDTVTLARAAMRPQRRAIREAWDQANATLTAEPFDKAKFKAAMGKLAVAEAALKGSVADVLGATAEILSPEERRELQAWREKRRPKIFRKTHGPDDPGKSPADDKDD